MSCLCYTGAAGDEPWASKTSVLAALQEAGPMRAKRPHAKHDAEDPMRGMQLADEEDPMLHMINERKAKKAKKDKKEKKEKKLKDKEKSRDKVIILKRTRRYVSVGCRHITCLNKLWAIGDPGLWYSEFARSL